MEEPVRCVIAALPLRRFNMCRCRVSDLIQGSRPSVKRRRFCCLLRLPLRPDPGIVSYTSTAPRLHMAPITIRYNQFVNQNAPFQSMFQSMSCQVSHCVICVSCSQCSLVLLSGAALHSVRNLKVKVQSQEWGPTGSRTRLSALT